MMLDPNAPMPRPPRWILALCLLMGLGLMVSALVALARQFSVPTTNWFVVGFEGLTLLSGLFGIGCGLGRFRDGPALAMACVGGTALMAAALGYTTGHKGWSGMLGDPLTVARLGVAAGFALAGALTAMARRPHASAASFVRGALMGGLALAAAGALGTSAGRNAIRSLHPVLAAMVFLTIGALLVAFVSASVHNFIRALEHGKEPLPEESPTGPSPG